MKINHVTIQNFKCLENLDQEVNGANLLLLAENGKGKSSFIQAIQIALGLTDKMPVNPVTVGQEEGSIKVITDDNGNEYKFEVEFGNGKPKTTVTGPNNLKSTTKSVIGGIVGEIDFDIDEFVKLSETTSGKKKQVEIVKSFLDQGTLEELKSIENRIESAYKDRTNINRDITTYDGFIKSAGMDPSDIKKYLNKIDVSELQKQIEDAITQNAEIDAIAERITSRRDEVKSNLDKVGVLQKEIEAIMAKNQELNDKNYQATEHLKKVEKVDTTTFQAQLSEAGEHNMKYQKCQDLKQKIDKKAELEGESGNLTVLIDTSRQALADAIRDMDLPVKGLSFNADTLLYNDKEVDLKTLSTSEIMHLGIQLKMAKSPNARVLFIERGESLGSERLKDIQKMAKQYDYQIIMEQVTRGQETLKIEIMGDITKKPEDVISDNIFERKIAEGKELKKKLDF